MLAGFGALLIGSTLARERPRPLAHRLQDDGAVAAAVILVVAALAAGGVFHAVADLGR